MSVDRHSQTVFFLAQHYKPDKMFNKRYILNTTDVPYPFDRPCTGAHVNLLIRLQEHF